MVRNYLDGISERSARVSMFLFFSLLFLSVTFFVFADDTVTDKNIFQDSDQDGLSNDEEALYKTDPLDKDSDDDGYMDGVEVESGYDPLKPAPGDRVAPVVTSNASEPSVSNTNNVTEQVSAEIATLVQANAAEGSGELTNDDIMTAMQDVLNQSDQEVVLPEVNMDEIKIKTVSKKLKAKQREEREREDAVEYLTVMAYILANNAPRKFSEGSDFGSMISSVGVGSLTSMALGDSDALEDLAKKGEKTLKEIKDIEVPEGMLDVHAKAIKMAKYSITLKEEVKGKNQQQDPLGQIASFSKIQGLLGVMSDFSQEVFAKMNDLGIEEIPLEL